jgi:hypothetical protein
MMVLSLGIWEWNLLWDGCEFTEVLNGIIVPISGSDKEHNFICAQPFVNW